MRSIYKIHDQEGVYFITSTVVEWIPIFTSKPYFDILISSIQYCQEHFDLAIFAWVILENHFHMVCAAPESSKVIQSLKRHTAKILIQRLEEDRKKWILDLLTFYKKRHKTGSEHQFGQEGVHPQQISSIEILNQKIEYVHFNPVKRGYVTEPEHWIYSSACDHSGKKGIVEIKPLPV